MAPSAPLAPAQALNVPAHTRMTRSASTLRKQVEPSTPAMDEDEDEDDEVVLAAVPPSRSSQQQQLSSQTRLQLARAGSSALDERVSDAPTAGDAPMGHATDEDGCFDYRALDEDARDAPGPMFDDDFREDDEDEEQDDEGEEEDVDDSRSEGELQAIGVEMDGVERAVPGLLGKYHLVDRLGEGALRSFALHAAKADYEPSTGTFSSVYKAIDLQHSAYDNSQWQPMVRKGKVHVAVKRIYVTSSPFRIQNELEILHDLR